MMKFFTIASHDSCAPVKNEDPASSISCISLVKERPMLTILRLDFLYVVRRLCRMDDGGVQQEPRKNRPCWIIRMQYSACISPAVPEPMIMGRSWVEEYGWMGGHCWERARYFESSTCVTAGKCSGSAGDLLLRRTLCAEGLRPYDIVARDSQRLRGKSSQYSLK